MPGNPYDDFLNGGGTSGGNPFGLRQGGNAGAGFLDGGNQQTAPPGGGGLPSSVANRPAMQGTVAGYGGSPTDRSSAASAFLNPSVGAPPQQPIAGYMQAGNTIGGTEQVGQYTSVNMDRGVQGVSYGSPIMNYGPMMGGTVPIDQFGRPVQGGQGGQGGSNITMDQLRQSAMYDQQQQQAAADRQWGRNNAESDAFRNFLGRAPGQIVGAGVYEGNRLDAEGARLEAQGLGDQARIQGAADRGYANTVGMVNQANAGLANIEPDIARAHQLYDQAASDFRGAMDNYQDMGAQQASATAAAIRAQFAAQRQQIDMGIRPDGTLMTPQERMAASSQLEFQVQQQLQPALTQILSHYNDTMLTAAGSLSQMTAAAGQSRFTGNDERIAAAGQRGNLAGVLNSAAGNLTQGTAQGVQARQQMAQLGASLVQQASQLRNAAMLNATQLEMQGRTQLADMVRQNPESVVSTFTTLMGLYSLQHAQANNAGAGGYSPPRGGGVRTPQQQGATQGFNPARNLGSGINNGQMGSQYSDAQRAVQSNPFPDNTVNGNSDGYYGNLGAPDPGAQFINESNSGWAPEFDPYGTNTWQEGNAYSPGRQ